MTDARYRRLAGDVLPPDTRDVLQWQNGIHFRCPCGQRRVYVTEPPHEIKFDAEGLLTITGSCGYAATDEHPANWCHFFIKGGEPEMCGDAQCPGGVAAQ